MPDFINKYDIYLLNVEKLLIFINIINYYMVSWHLINKISNSISLLLWAGLALKIASRLVADYPNYLHSDHT
jgi:hypothetical protein